MGLFSFLSRIFGKNDKSIEEDYQDGELEYYFESKTLFFKLYDSFPDYINSLDSSGEFLKDLTKDELTLMKFEYAYNLTPNFVEKDKVDSYRHNYPLFVLSEDMALGIKLGMDTAQINLIIPIGDTHPSLEAISFNLTRFRRTIEKYKNNISRYYDQIYDSWDKRPNYPEYDRGVITYLHFKLNKDYQNDDY